MSFVTLMTPARFGSLELKNRVVMAPMTRSRAGADGEITDIMVEYYRQASLEEKLNTTDLTLTKKPTKPKKP